MSCKSVIQNRSLQIDRFRWRVLCYRMTEPFLRKTSVYLQPRLVISSVMIIEHVGNGNEVVVQL